MIKSLDNAESNDLLGCFKVGNGQFQKHLKINGHSVSMIFDTCAQVSIIDENLFKKVSNDAPLFPVDNVIREYSGRPINIKGAADVIVEAKNYVFL